MVTKLTKCQRIGKFPEKTRLGLVWGHSEIAIAFGTKPQAETGPTRHNAELASLLSPLLVELIMIRLKYTLLMFAIFVSISTTRLLASDDVVIADFESTDYASWIVTGNAFGAGPAQGTLPGQMNVDGFLGRGLVNSFSGGDDSTGSLTSPPFRIERKYIAFLIGGGKNEKTLALQILLDGNVVRSVTGPNDQPGGSERLAQEALDVSELAGKLVTLRIIDEAKGGWGHINVDHIMQTNTKPIGLLIDAERELLATARYLNIPIRNGAPKREVTLLVDSVQVVRNTIELADDHVDAWMPMDLSQWQGKKLTLRVDKLPENSSALSSIELSNRWRDTEKIYRESLRGQFHFSPRHGWNNDPNGMVFYNGEYHLFFQHNPYGWSWGNMHWGHAVSKDMIHWEELRDELLPDEFGPMFSGSAVVDWNNTSGFGHDGRPPLVLIYTAAGNPTVQCIAYSTDGRNFTKYDRNPILKEVTGGNRDPKVFWHEPTKKWVMVLYVEWQKKHTIHFFTSSNLRDWTLRSISEGDSVGSPYLFECPDFFELPVDGDATRKKWVLLAANGAYAIGGFDGEQFTPEHSNLSGHRGRGFYAPQTFSDIPKADGRRILMGWWQTETRGMPFNQSMTIPLELGLASTVDGPRMTFTPVRELASLRTKVHHFDSIVLNPGDRNPLEAIRIDLVEIRAEIEPDDASEIVFNIRGVMVVYSPKLQELRVDDRRLLAPLVDGKLLLTVYCDRTGVEVFASQGLCYVPLPWNVSPENLQLFLETRDGQATIQLLDVFELQSAWQ